MITITQECNYYEVKFSAPGTGWRSYKVKAQDFTEIVQALEHHLVQGGKRVPGHTYNRHRKCPLCRQSKREEAAREARERRKRKS